MSSLPAANEHTASYEQLLRGFLQTGKSLNTRLARARDLGIPLEWVPGRSPRDPAAPRKGPKPQPPSGLAWLHWCLARELALRDVRVRHVEQWLEDLAQAGYDNATRGRMLSTVSKFYSYLLREELVERNPADASLIDRSGHHLNRNKGPSQTRPVSFEQCRALLEAAWLACDQRRNGRRDRAMVELLVGTGIRADELVGVNLADYHRPYPAGDATLTVHGKGEKDRVVALPVPVADALEDYLAVRVEPDVPAPMGQVGPRRQSAIFVSATGHRLHPSHLTRMLRGLCAHFAPRTTPRSRRHQELLATARAGMLGSQLRPLRDSLHPHQFRHSYATHAIQRDVSLRQVQRDLGHEGSDTTEGYLHDSHNARNSAAHELAPALHRGWLTPRSTFERERASQDGEIPGQTGIDLTDGGES